MVAEEEFYPLRQEGKEQSREQPLLYNRYVAKVYNTFGYFTTEKRVIRGLISSGRCT